MTDTPRTSLAEPPETSHPQVPATHTEKSASSQPANTRQDAIEHAKRMVKRYQTAAALHPIERDTLTARQEHERVNLEHWQRRLAKITASGPDATESIETRVREWARIHGFNVEQLVDDYTRYLEDLPTLRYPDLPPLTPAEFVDEHWGEFERDSREGSQKEAPLELG